MRSVRNLNDCYSARQSHAPSGVPQLVAPVAIANHALDVQVDVAALLTSSHQYKGLAPRRATVAHLACVGDKRKAQRIRAALGNACNAPSAHIRR